MANCMDKHHLPNFPRNIIWEIYGQTGPKCREPLDDYPNFHLFGESSNSDLPVNRASTLIILKNLTITSSKFNKNPKRRKLTSLYHQIPASFHLQSCHCCQFPSDFPVHELLPSSPLHPQQTQNSKIAVHLPHPQTPILSF
uniref:Uncharacterized protein n=1 Tax=Solanum tuberosum TaxID=4113 RepID=M0ZGE0_SOLTU